MAFTECPSCPKARLCPHSFTPRTFIPSYTIGTLQRHLRPGTLLTSLSTPNPTSTVCHFQKSDIALLSKKHLITMNTYSLEQLNAHARDKNTSSATNPHRKREKFLDFFGINKVDHKVKAKISTQPLRSQLPLQESTPSSGASQVNDNQDKPLPEVPTVDPLHTDIFLENVLKPAN
ncbi:hypothetical protein BKA57DRAFT_514563 [Linnemannia elongata]|nr:hypothetical protein BKA57DRAFT_514563 [Linnemannia elongata]